jgi:chromosome segregation ATPase
MPYERKDNIMNKHLKKLLALLMSVVVALSLSVTAFAAGEVAGANDLAGLTTGDAEPTDPALAALKEDYATVVSLRQQEKELLRQIADMSKTAGSTMREIAGKVRQQISAAKESDTARDVILDLRTRLNTLRSQLEALRAQASTLAAAVHTNQSAVALDRNELQSAMKSGDTQAAGAALQTIITLQRQNITTLNAIVGTRQQVAGLLNDFLTTLASA